MMNKLIRTASALFLSAVLVLGCSQSAFANRTSHEVLAPGSYVLEETDTEGIYGEEEGPFLNDQDGEPLTGWIENDDEELFYFQDGIMNRGWDKIKGKWYYFDPDTGVLATNTTVLNYDVDEDGCMVKIRTW